MPRRNSKVRLPALSSSPCMVANQNSLSEIEIDNVQDQEQLNSDPAAAGSERWTRTLRQSGQKGGVYNHRWQRASVKYVIFVLIVSNACESTFQQGGISLVSWEEGGACFSSHHDSNSANATAL